jgi:hypothetical protein
MTAWYPYRGLIDGGKAYMHDVLAQLATNLLTLELPLRWHDRTAPLSDFSMFTSLEHLIIPGYALVGESLFFDIKADSCYYQPGGRSYISYRRLFAL